jgi:hypothetical protein
VKWSVSSSPAPTGVLREGLQVMDVALGRALRHGWELCPLARRRLQGRGRACYGLWLSWGASGGAWTKRCTSRSGREPRQALHHEDPLLGKLRMEWCRVGVRWGQFLGWWSSA